MISYRKNIGLSLIELLVALLLSTFLILGITYIYLSNKESYSFQKAQELNISNGRFLEITLNELIGKAGYLRSPDQSLAEAFPAATKLGSYCEKFEEGNVLVNAKDNKGFCLRYQPTANGEALCSGAVAKLSNKSAFLYPKSEETIYLAVIFEPNNNLEDGAIKCVTENAEADIADGVADFKIMYGVGSTLEKRVNNNTPFVQSEKYNGTDTIRVASYSILLASSPNKRKSQSVIYKDWLITVNNETKKFLEKNDNNRIYHVVKNTQVLKNMMP